MQYAKVAGGEMVEAEPFLTAICPNCEKEVVPKCGDVMVWHWAHKDLSECDPFWEPESSWHRGWKRLVKSQFCEVPINGHRADIVADDGIVIELQHSPIDMDVIAEREAAYGRMVWLFDVRDPYVEERFHVWAKRGYDGFRWYRPRVATVTCKQKVCFDLGPSVGVFEVKEMEYKKSCMRGWGDLWPRDLFINKYLKYRQRKAEPETIRLLPQQMNLL